MDTPERISLSTEFDKLKTTAYAGEFRDPECEVKPGVKLSKPDDFEVGQIPLLILVLRDGKKLSVDDLESRDKLNQIK